MKKRAAIIGGGVAGLSVARLLVGAGCEVTLLEAKPHLGGRVHTITAGAQLIELGAEFLHGESQTMFDVIQAGELSTDTVSTDYKLFEQGHFKRVELLEKMSKILHQVDIRHRDCSFQEFLDTQKLNDADREQASGFVQGFHAAQPRRISAHSLRRAEYSAEHMQSTKQGRMTAGYGALVKFLQQEIWARGGKLITNAVVEKVRWQTGDVEVTYHHGDREILKADAAVITLPLGVLKAGTVEFQPPLAVKQETIEQLQFGNVIKVIFQFREQWWPKFGFILALEEAFPTWWTDPRGPILTAWAGGPKADALLDHSGPQLETLGLEILARLFPKQLDAIATQFISSYSFNWVLDPYTRGAYSYLPVNGLDLPKLLAAPVADTLFFAGEATVTDAQTGTVLGAFETGLRAGRELLNSLAGLSNSTAAVQTGLEFKEV